MEEKNIETEIKQDAKLEHNSNEVKVNLLELFEKQSAQIDKLNQEIVRLKIERESNPNQEPKKLKL